MSDILFRPQCVTVNWSLVRSKRTSSGHPGNPAKTSTSVIQYNAMDLQKNNCTAELELKNTYLVNESTLGKICLTHWGRSLTIIGWDNGLSPGRHQATIWTSAGILLIRLLGTNFSEILIEIHTFSFQQMHLKRSSAKWQPFCLGINVLITTDVKPKKQSSFLRHAVIAYLVWSTFTQANESNKRGQN